MTRVTTVAARAATAFALIMLLLVAAPADAQAPSGELLRGFGIDERLDRPSVLGAALETAKTSTKDVPLFVRLAVDRGVVAAAARTGAWDALDARIGVYERLSMPVLVTIVADTIAAKEDVDWRNQARALAARYRGRVFGYQLDLRAGAPRPDAPSYAYLLRIAAVQIRSVDAKARIGLATLRADDVDWLTALQREDIAAYVDVVPVEADEIDSPATSDPVAPLRTLVSKFDPTAIVIDAGARLSGSNRTAVGRWLAFAFARLGDPNLRFTISGAADEIAAALSAAATLKDVFGGELTTLDPGTVKLSFAIKGADVTSRLAHRLLYSLSNFSTYLAYWGAPEGGEVAVSLIDSTERSPVARDALRHTVTPVAGFAWDPSSKSAKFRAPTPASPLILDFNYGAAPVFAVRENAATTALPSAAEVVFRHQQAQARQESLYRTFVATARMEQKFRAGTESFNVVSDNRFFSGRDSVEWEELMFDVNGSKWGPDRPDFPVLQAEKVLSLPLDLRLTADYAYQLDGTDTVDGRRCYVLSFDPLDPVHSRYRGRIWIDADTYVRLRLNAIQTKLDGLIVSSEEVHSFAPAATIGDETLFLTRRVVTTQQILIAGQNIQLEKILTFDHFEIDDPDFETRRDTARQSNRIMFRDTPEGLRYLVKSGTERVVSDRMTMSSRALAMGTTIDPSFDFPVPLVGLNYLNFKFLGEGSQLALLWGGPLALGNIQKPQFGGIRSLDASVDFFVLAAPSASSVFDATGERRGERVMTIPVSTGLNLGYQLNAFQKLRLGYQFRFDGYFADHDTAADFGVPASTTTHGIGVEYRFARRGYSIGASATVFRRLGWHAWGLPGTFDASTAHYRRHSLSAAKDFHLTTFQTLRTAVSWHAGAGLDRFSMYQFGMFDEVRMHGVPAAGVRFPEVVLARVSYGFNIFDIYRLDLFFDRAAGRDPDDHQTWHPVTGTGVALNLRAPWRTIFRADIGKSFVPERYAGAGAWTLQLMLLKPL